MSPEGRGLSGPNIGVLIIQLGTPDEPTRRAVRHYLREFLSDPRVIEAPPIFWELVLRLVILPRRSRGSAAKYARIWDSRTGSPLLHYTRLQAQALERSLPGGFTVRFGMRYGNPSITEAVNGLLELGVRKLIVLPMYPQYSAATTGSACDRLFETFKRQRFVPSVRVVSPFYASPGYIRAQAQLIRAELSKLHRPPGRILFSFHGYPVDSIRKGDPYQFHVETTAKLLGRELGLGEGEWLLAYQSRFGRKAWLEPFTEQSVQDLARRGVRRVLVASPGFTTDCLETIDEIGRELAAAFQRAGGEELVRCPCLNDEPAWIEAMCELVLTESKGWY